MVSIIKTLLKVNTKEGEPMDSKKAQERAAAAKAAVPMTKAYDVAALGKRLKEVGVVNGEQLAGEIYFVSKEWAKESAPLSENKIDDVAAPFYDQADQFVLPQIEKIDGKEG